MATLAEEIRPGLEEDGRLVQQYGEKDESPAAAAPRGPQSRAEDVELLRRIAGGDEAAFRVLVDRHARYLTGVALALAGNNAADAEDLVQETFTAVLTSRYRGESAARTWLVNILVRRAAMLRRSRRRERGEPAGESPEQGAASAEGGSDAKLDVARMLEGLSPDQRQVIVLRELQGLSYEQMAEVLKVPRGTVESRLHRARAALKELFRGYL
jgi:RNA polymerase sigma-70 factor (ECF subfamily)